jgi:[acyl-carrier-protein] S-malonyltransferase
MQTLLERGVEQLIELPPAGTLAGLAKRGMKGIPALAVNSAEELEQARSILG